MEAMTQRLKLASAWNGGKGRGGGYVCVCVCVCVWQHRVGVLRLNKCRWVSEGFDLP